MALKHLFKDIVENARAQMAVRKGLVWWMHQFTITDELHNIKHEVCVNDLMLISLGLPSRVPGAAACVLHTGRYAIFVNNAFRALPHAFQIAILAHEKAHIDKDHCKSKSNFTMMLRNSIRGFVLLREEAEADDYAFNLFGTTYIAALKELRSKMFSPEVTTRINRLTRRHRLEVGISHA